MSDPTQGRSSPAEPEILGCVYRKGLSITVWRERAEVKLDQNLTFNWILMVWGRGVSFDTWSEF